MTLSIIYFQLYLFYKNILKEENPHFTTTWGVGIGLAIIIVFPLYAFLPIIYCGEVKTIILFLISILIFLVFDKYITFKGRRDNIVKTRPLFKGNKFYSKMIAIFFFIIISCSMLFWPLIARIIRDKYCF